MAAPITPPVHAYWPAARLDEPPGTLFIAGSTSVCSTSSGAMLRATSGERGALDGDDDEVLRAEFARQRPRALAPAAPVAFAQPPALRAQRLQRGTARERRDLRAAGGGQARADEPADRAGADDARTLRAGEPVETHAAMMPLVPFL